MVCNYIVYSSIFLNDNMTSYKEYRNKIYIVIMYQSSIRDKKKIKNFNHQKDINYALNVEEEEYAYVKKLLGNCRVQVITNSGIEAIGIIRGSLRKFNKRLLIEVGDVVVASKRDYQASKVDIVHKFNSEQVQNLIMENKLSNIICNNYNNHGNHHTISNGNSSDCVQSQYNDQYIDFGDITSSSEEDIDDECNVDDI